MTPTTEAAIRTALLDRMRGRTIPEVARVSGVHPRTLRRLLEGPTFGIRTVRRVATALRVDLDRVIADSSRPVEVQDGAGRGKMGQNGANLSPVVGWKQAAQVLEVSRWTLHRARSATGCQREPWWPSPEACLEWYAALAVTGW